MRRCCFSVDAVQGEVELAPLPHSQIQYLMEYPSKPTEVRAFFLLSSLHPVLSSLHSAPGTLDPVLSSLHPIDG